MAKLYSPNESPEQISPVSRGVRAITELQPLVFSIHNGDLKGAKYPLVIGHYHGDGIVNTELRLDRLLRGRLTNRLNMLLYPGPRGTVDVIHAPECLPPGALVIGLGNVGEIKTSIVATGITNAA